MTDETSWTRSAAKVTNFQCHSSFFIAQVHPLFDHPWDAVCNAPTHNSISWTQAIKIRTQSKYIPTKAYSPAVRDRQRAGRDDAANGRQWRTGKRTTDIRLMSQCHPPNSRRLRNISFNSNVIEHDHDAHTPNVVRKQSRRRRTPLF